MNTRTGNLSTVNANRLRFEAGWSPSPSGVFCVLFVSLLVGPSLLGQQPPGSQKEPLTAPALPPFPPISFRQLLEMSAAGREPILATRSPQQRRLVEGKLLEYESLPPAEREARLCTLQLRLYLQPMLQVPPSNRLERLEVIPQPDRKLVEERLQFWDQLPPEVQRGFLTNEWAQRYIFRPETIRPEPHVNMPKGTQERIEQAIQSWNQLSDPKRREILENSQRILEVSAAERAKVLNKFGETERQQMQNTLRTFEQLPKSQRDRCLNGFQRFAGLSPQERQQFLNNVELWQTMSAQDRQAWQSLVSRIAVPAPPFPPGPDGPPMPPVPPNRASTILSSTNY